MAIFEQNVRVRFDGSKVDGLSDGDHVRGYEVLYAAEPYRISKRWTAGDIKGGLKIASALGVRTIRWANGQGPSKPGSYIAQYDSSNDLSWGTIDWLVDQLNNGQYTAPNGRVDD